MEPSRQIVEKFKAQRLHLKNLAVMGKTFAELHLRQNPPDRAKAGAYSAVSCLCFAESHEWAAVKELLNWIEKEKLWGVHLIKSFKDELERKISSASIVVRAPTSSNKSVRLPFAPALEFSSASSQLSKMEENTIFLSSLTSDQLQTLLSDAHPKKFAKNSVVFGQGDYPENFYIVVQGSVRLRSTNGFEKTIGTGEIFGEMAVLGHMQRTATAECLSESLLLEFNKENLYKFFEKHPELEKQIQKTFEFRLFCLRARHISALGQLEEKTLRELFDLFQSTNIAVGQVLIKEGDKSDGIFCILSGLLQISRHQTPLATLGPGDFVGEVGAFKSIPRTADVVGATDALLLWCHGDKFNQLKTKFPVLSQYLESLSNQRMANSLKN